MPTVTFFHNERADDALRTGLYVDDARAFERFVPGGDEYDPSLRWYVDVGVPVAEAPETQTAAAEWLAEHADSLRVALDVAAERLHAGIDSDGGPWSFDVDTPDGTTRVTVSAQRRASAKHLGERLRELIDRHLPAFQNEFAPALAGVPQ